MGKMMLAVHAKKTDPADLKQPMLSYINHTYSPQQANDAADDLTAVQQMRTTVTTLTGSLPSLQDTLLKYFHALGMIEARFPIGLGRDQVRIAFTWYDAFKSHKRMEAYSLNLERAAVLFNVGAVLTQQALSADQSTSAGLVDCARKFQEAAGVFGFLRDGPALKVEPPRPTDLTPECCHMLERLCLAQAQEAAFDKARADGKGPATLGRLGKQASLFYEEVQRCLFAPPLASHFDKSWTAHASVKAAVYDTEAQLQSAADLHSKDEIALEICRLQEAHKSVAAAKREVKHVGKELQDAVVLLNDTLIKALSVAERENSTVYLQRIPPNPDLPKILPAAIVKPILLPGLAGAQNESLFTSVIPDSSARALSKYTDMVDSVTRQQLDRLAEASNDARLRLRQWELPECLQALDAGSSAALPEGLRHDLEELEEHGGVAHLKDLGAQIKDLREVAQNELKQVEADLDRESREDGELRDRFQQRWARPASAALNSTLREKIAAGVRASSTSEEERDCLGTSTRTLTQGYNANMVSAGDSDARLIHRLDNSSSAFSALSLDLAISQMPRLQAPMVSTGDVEPATVVHNLRQALDAIGGLSSERASLEQALKEEKARDNVLPRLMASGDSPDALFREEIKKYDPLVAKVEANLQKQGQLMEAIDRNQAAYKHAFGYREWRSACEASSGSMAGKLREFRELRDNLSEGLRFYMSLQEAIAILRQQAGDYVLTRRLQRDDLLEDLKRASQQPGRPSGDMSSQMGAMHMGSAPSGGPPGPPKSPPGGPPPPQGGQPQWPPAPQYSQHNRPAQPYGQASQPSASTSQPPYYYQPQQQQPQPQQPYSQAPGFPPQGAPQYNYPPPQGYYTHASDQRQSPPPPSYYAPAPPTYHGPGQSSQSSSQQSFQNPSYQQPGGSGQGGGSTQSNPLWGGR